MTKMYNANMEAIYDALAEGLNKKQTAFMNKLFDELLKLGNDYHDTLPLGRRLAATVDTKVDVKELANIISANLTQNYRPYLADLRHTEDPEMQALAKISNDIDIAYKQRKKDNE